MRVLDSGDDVLPPISSQQRGGNPSRLRSREAAPCVAEEIVSVHLGLRLQYAVDGGHQANQIVYCLVALHLRKRGVFIGPLQFIEYNVLALVPPVEFEYVLEQRAQILMRRDALFIM